MLQHHKRLKIIDDLVNLYDVIVIGDSCVWSLDYFCKCHVGSGIFFHEILISHLADPFYLKKSKIFRRS